MNNIMDVYYYFFWGLCALSFLLRKQKPFNWIWGIYKTLFILLFIILFANYAKGKIKEWWKNG